ncbi:MAG: HD domain-containing protein [Bacteroidetes bacterium]|nr:MAG: HD domain-containing protein [Bacteroidota bacterium]
MENFEKEKLVNMVIAPYVQKATALRGIKRYVGGNQFRHALSTYAILIDYHYVDHVLLKASVIHDIFEDVKCISFDEITNLDQDGPAVLRLVLEVTKKTEENKDEYLERLLKEGSENAKTLKCADRISNLTDLHPDIFEKDFIRRYLDETKKWVLPMAEQVNKNMLYELEDLIHRREALLKFLPSVWPFQRKNS